MKRTILYLLTFIIVFVVYLFYSYLNTSEIEGLTSIYDSVKSATDSQTALINALQDTIKNDPNVSAAIKNLPDGGASIMTKIKAATTASNDALNAAQGYK